MQNFRTNSITNIIMKVIAAAVAKRPAKQQPGGGFLTSTNFHPSN
jgi:hypothetical protein